MKAACLHHIGSKVVEEGVTLSNDVLQFDDTSKRNLMTYCFSSFKNEEKYSFTNEVSLEFNETMACVKKMFTDATSIVEQSKLLAKLLYERSERPGIKSGDLAVNVEGVNEPLTIVLSGTVLDSSKFFENFEANNTSDMMPAGWWDIDNEWEKTDNTNGNNNYVSADLVAAHKLITPLLKVTEGEKMSFEARKKSSSSELFVNVYYSHDRKEWTLVKEISASDMDQTNFQTYVVEGVPAGDF